MLREGTGASDRDRLTEVAGRRLRYGVEFLERRGLRPTELVAAVEKLYPELDHLLLTSSPVQGLANHTSDVDLIGVCPVRPDGPPLATQVFHGPHHLEAICFPAEDVSASMAVLGAAASAGAEGAVAAFRRWDADVPVRRKYLERIVNGVALGEGTMPYLDHLPALARVWMWASVDTAVRSGSLAIVAERAGERRGRLGYALNAFLFLADALLSSQLDVYSNKKWYLERWLRSVPALAERDPGPVECLERLRAELGSRLTGRGAGPGLAASLVRLLQHVPGWFRPGPGGGLRMRLTARAGVEARPFLEGASLALVARGRAGMLDAGTVPEEAESWAPEELADLPPARCRLLLKLLRMGAADLEVEW
jgi:hypothetical protein